MLPNAIEVKLYRIDEGKRRGRTKMHGPKAGRGPKAYVFHGPPRKALVKLAQGLEKMDRSDLADLDSMSVKFVRREP